MQEIDFEDALVVWAIQWYDNGGCGNVGFLVNI